MFLNDSMSQTGFGSCFLWVDSRTRDNYLVSCEHVTHDAHHLTATFQSRNGDLVSIEDTEIVFTDRSRDLAFLSIGQTSRNGVKVSLQPVDEGMTEVWSAGFPALGVTPVFQVSKGYITNSEVTIIPHGEFIQHDANISAASSGGPLVTSVKAAEKNVLTASETFAVVGVNAAIARGRANTFFAIPGSVLANFIERALKYISPEEDIWEEENNNTRDSATIIQLNTEINGTLNPLNDEDWYRVDISVSPEKTVDVVLVVRGNDDFSVELYKLNGETVRTVKNTDGTIQFQMETGSVFIQFKQEIPYFDVYSLKVLLQK
jgi:hypothetical protein